MTEARAEPHQRGEVSDRAVSTAVSYSLVILISLTLTAGLIVGADALVADQRDQATQTQLDAIGQRLSSTIGTADRLAAGESPAAASVSREFPRRISGSQYLITVRHPDPARNRYLLVLESRGSDARTTVAVTTDLPLAADQSFTASGERRLNGGPIRVTFVNPSGDPARLEVQRD